ncbi:MAG: hypothetical protein QHH15_00190 [Candidatus Thermoplasmatota archaeon]|nr:hypothetical protein [Candidatus Thermoplasmatota archaeon]
MAENKELGIKITGDISDVQSSLETLKELFEGIVDKAIDVMVNVNDEQLIQLQSDISNLENQTIDERIEIDDTALNEAMATTDSLDGVTISEYIVVDDAALKEAMATTDSLDGVTISEYIVVDDTELNEAMAFSDSLDGYVIEETIEVDDSSLVEAEASASSLSDTISNMDTSSLTQMDTAADGVKTSMDDAANSTAGFKEQAAGAGDAAGGVQTALAGITTIGIGAFFTDAITKAGDFETSWRRLGVAMDEGTQSIPKIREEWDSTISAMTEKTGRGAGVIREYLIQMGNVGIQNKDVLISMFEGIASAAFVTGNSIDQIEKAIQRVIITGKLSNRQLVQLGLTEQDVMGATGLSIDQVNQKLQGMDSTQRAAFMAMILNAKYGTEANDAYKRSWEYVLDVLTRTWDYMVRVVGQLILPIVIPAVNLLANAIKAVGGFLESLPAPIQAVIGAFLALVGGITMIITLGVAFAGILSALGISLSLQGIQLAITNGLYVLYSAAMGIATAATVLYNLAISGQLAQFLVLVGRLILVIAQLGIYAIAVGLATAAQLLLNAAMNANPVVLLISAIAGLITFLYLLVTNLSSVTNAVNWLWESLLNGIKWIQQVGQAIWDFFMNLPKIIGESMSKWWDAIKDFGNWLIKKFDEILLWLEDEIAKEMKALGEGTGGGWMDGFMKWLEDNWWKIEEFIGDLFTQILPRLLIIVGKVGMLIALKLINSIKDWLIDLPNQMYQWGKSAVDAFIQAIIDAIPGLRKALDLVKRLFPHSPPKEGPLSDVTEEKMAEFGANLGSAFGSGLASSMKEIQSYLGEGVEVVLKSGLGGAGNTIEIPDNEMKIMNTTMANLNQPNVTNDFKLSLAIQVDNVNANTSQEAKEALVNVEEAVKDILSRQLAQKGINLF